MNAPRAFFDHTALLYRSQRELGDRVGAVIADGLERDESVLVCVDEATWAAIAPAVDGPGDGVTFMPVGERDLHPGTAMGRLASFMAAQLRSGATGVRSIGQIRFDGTSRDHDWIRYEAAVNDMFAALPFHAVCLFDVEGTPPDLLRFAERTHRHVDDGAARLPSPAFDDPVRVTADLPQAGLTPDRAPDVHLPAATDVRATRHAVSAAVATAIPTTMIREVELVVTELVANANVHAGTPADVALWLEPGAVVVEVTDGGGGWHDPFPGLRPPVLTLQGAGLWIVNQIAERMAIRPGPHGTAVAARLALPRPDG